MAGWGAVLLRWIDGYDVREVAQRDCVFIAELFAIQHLLRGTVAEDLEAKDPIDIRTERLDEVVDVGGEAVDHRGDEDDGGDTDHDAEDGEAGAQLVCSQRLGRHSDCFFSVTQPHGSLLRDFRYNSARRATMGSSLAAFRAG